MTRSGVISLTTDFGTRDPYVAAMKGVVLSMHPRAVIVDVTHEISPGGIREAAEVLAQATPWFPAGTVHVAVVDPGVGTERRAIAATAGGQLFVGPDNGVLQPALRALGEPRVIHLNDARFFLETVSRTFHGRDVFAPVAAHLAMGRDLEDMGDPVTDVVSLDPAHPREEQGALIGEVARVDRFGNLVTSIRREDLDAFLRGRRPRIRAGRLTLDGLQGCYGDVNQGDALALIGSGGALEISVNGGRASDRAVDAGEDPLDLKVRVTALA